MFSIINTISACAGLYVGIWMLLIKSIVNACRMYGEGTLTNSVIGWTLFKCIISIPVMEIVYVVVGILLMILCRIMKDIKEKFDKKRGK